MKAPINFILFGLLALLGCNQSPIPSMDFSSPHLLVDSPVFALTESGQSNGTVKLNNLTGIPIYFGFHDTDWTSRIMPNGQSSIELLPGVDSISIGDPFDSLGVRFPLVGSQIEIKLQPGQKALFFSTSRPVNKIIVNPGRVFQKSYFNPPKISGAYFCGIYSTPPTSMRILDSNNVFIQIPDIHARVTKIDSIKNIIADPEYGDTLLVSAEIGKSIEIPVVGRGDFYQTKILYSAIDLIHLPEVEVPNFGNQERTVVILPPIFRDSNRVHILSFKIASKDTHELVLLLDYPKDLRSVPSNYYKNMFDSSRTAIQSDYKSFLQKGRFDILASMIDGAYDQLKSNKPVYLFRYAPTGDSIFLSKNDSRIIDLFFYNLNTSKKDFGALMKQSGLTSSEILYYGGWIMAGHSIALFATAGVVSGFAAPAVAIILASYAYDAIRNQAYGRFGADIDGLRKNQDQIANGISSPNNFLESLQKMVLDDHAFETTSSCDPLPSGWVNCTCPSQHGVYCHQNTMTCN